MMRIGVVGGGASGVFAAIRIKQKHPEWNVSIFERNDKLLKKIYATGNGRCNFANSASITDAYNNDNFVKNIINDFNYSKIVEFFNSIGIASRQIDTLYYPYSLSAATVAEKFVEQVKKLKIDVVLNCKIIDYIFEEDNFILKTSDTNYKVDKIIFACGGKSYPNLGTDGSVFSLLEKHGYEIEKLSPSLCPIKVKENVNKIDGVRAKARVFISAGNSNVFQEDGEVQFRKDAISGIVIFNASFMINKLKLHSSDITIHLDFVPEIKESISSNDYSKFLQEKLCRYLIDNKQDIHNTIFTFKSLYSFDNSQVSSGGISLENIDKNSLESKQEKNVYFIGEILDIDARCGGYNLMWAYASAERVSELCF